MSLHIRTSSDFSILFCTKTTLPFIHSSFIHSQSASLKRSATETHSKGVVLAIPFWISRTLVTEESKWELV